MEDVYLLYPSLTEQANLFGVFDGHSHYGISYYVAKELGKVLLANENF
jgi:serine/threonine protein phosphatase PrpC